MMVDLTTLHPSVAAYLPTARVYEDDVPWPYLDSDDPPNVTVGIGCAIALPEATTLAFTIGGAAATVAQIVAEYRKLEAMDGGRVAMHYQYDGCLMLSEDARVALFAERCEGGIAALEGMFAEWQAWPLAAQVASLDMVFQLGPGRIREYGHWAAALNQSPPDFVAAGRESGIETQIAAFDARNRWLQEQFMAAASVEAEA